MVRVRVVTLRTHAILVIALVEPETSLEIHLVFEYDTNAILVIALVEP